MSLSGKGRINRNISKRLLPAASIPTQPRGCAVYSACTCWPRPNSRYQNRGILCPNAPNLLLGSKSHFPGCFPNKICCMYLQNCGWSTKDQGQHHICGCWHGWAVSCRPWREDRSWGRGSGREGTSGHRLIVTSIQASTDVRGRTMRI